MKGRIDHDRGGIPAPVGANVRSLPVSPYPTNVGRTSMPSMVWIALIAFAARASVRLYSGEADFWHHGYGFFFRLAQNMASGNGFAFEGSSPTAFRVPLYSVFLAAVTGGVEVFVPIVIVQSLIGAGTVCCAALIAKDLFNKPIAITAAALTAVYPYYVVHDTALQDTSLYTFLTAVAILLLLRTSRRGSPVLAASAGLVLGLLVLTRATLAPFAAFAPIWLALKVQFGDSRQQPRARIGLLCAGVMLLVVSPWLLRSYLLTGSPTLSTEAGQMLWAGNNPYTFCHYPKESIDLSKIVAYQSLSMEEYNEVTSLGNEADVDRWFRSRAFTYIVESPRQTFGNGIRKIGAAFAWWPNPTKDFWPSLAHAVSFGPVMVFGLLGMWVNRRNWREHSIFYVLFALFAALTAVFFGHTSHRAYLDLYWIVFAAAALHSLSDSPAYKLFWACKPNGFYRIWHFLCGPIDGPTKAS